jgi:hypothetical protein
LPPMFQQEQFNVLWQAAMIMMHCDTAQKAKWIVRALQSPAYPTFGRPERDATAYSHRVPAILFIAERTTRKGKPCDQSTETNQRVGLRVPGDVMEAPDTREDALRVDFRPAARVLHARGCSVCRSQPAHISISPPLVGGIQCSRDGQTAGKTRDSPPECRDWSTCARSRERTVMRVSSRRRTGLPFRRYPYESKPL